MMGEVPLFGESRNVGGNYLHQYDVAIHSTTRSSQTSVVSSMHFTMYFTYVTNDYHLCSHLCSHIIRILCGNNTELKLYTPEIPGTLQVYVIDI